MDIGAVDDWEEAYNICTGDRCKKQNIERRSSQLEVRAKGRKLEGYAATFGTEARIGDFTETIAPGAFNLEPSSKSDVLALVDHDPSRVLARTKSNTLRLAEDTKGLHFDLDVPRTSTGNDVLALAERGDLGGMSFGFITIKDQWDGAKRTLQQVDLKEISVVSAWPAYEGTVVNARAKGLSPSYKPRLTLARKYLETL
jgi:HK97 family phage prohead protease